jgi:hypothetical protein
MHVPELASVQSNVFNKELGAAEILDRYSPILNRLSRPHPNYVALLCGSIQWLLQDTMNCPKLLRRLSNMLEQLGDYLPGFMLYES